ncbi:MAG TPA: hypothetical protein VMH81_12490 [Bryobacteraceae bacterium]|nr:hypothetical protein [Bryobacteraceae bacterium]
MKKRIKTIIHKSTSRGLLLGTLAVSVTLLIASDSPQQGHDSHGGPAPAKLVQTVRNATTQFVNVNAATAAGYQPLFGCVSGPDHGAMGIHYINLALYGDGKLDATRPEALIYEPSNGGLALVGVEYIVDAATWLSQNSSPPMLEGQAFLLVTSPNRYGLPAFFELHVWAWRESPNGAFVDWNTNVSCEGQ